MTAFDVDWQYMRRGCVVPLLTAFVSAALLVVAVTMRGEYRGIHAELEANQLAAQEDYNALVLKRRLIDRYHERYRQFHEQGFVGIESRLDWVEALRASTGKLTLPNLSYAIAPQLDVAAPVRSSLAADDIAVHMSRLELEIGLVHEFDLLRFVDALQNQAPGLMRVERCGLTWQNQPGVAVAAVGANIAANCSLEMFSLVTSDVRIEVARR